MVTTRPGWDVVRTRHVWARRIPTELWAGSAGRADRPIPPCGRRLHKGIQRWPARPLAHGWRANIEYMCRVHKGRVLPALPGVVARRLDASRGKRTTRQDHQRQEGQKAWTPTI